jgi:hypothetical protein
MRHKAHLHPLVFASILISSWSAFADMSVETFERNMASGDAPALAARYYITGIEDGLSWANVESKKRFGVKLYCSPGSIALQGDQIIDIMRRFVRAHDYMDLQEQRVGVVLLLALEELFPCPPLGRTRQ